jgi:hypothetical protein
VQTGMRGPVQAEQRPARILQGLLLQTQRRRTLRPLSLIPKTAGSVPNGTRRFHFHPKVEGESSDF